MNVPVQRGPGAQRRWLLGTLTSLVTMVVLLAGTELVLRVRRIPFRESWTPSENAMAQFDPDLGWSYVPSQSHELTFGRNEREVEVHFDAFGARVGSSGATADPSRPTVLFVGGSYTMGHGLPHEETFVGRLERDTAFSLQVLNLGVQGYGTDQSLLRLQRQIGRFRCVVVVYTFLDKHVRRNGNDDRRLMIPSARFLGTKPLFDLRSDGSLYLEKRPARYEEMLQSNLWNWIRLAWYRKRPPPGPELTRALVKEMVEVSRAHGARFVMVVWRQGAKAEAVPDLEWEELASTLRFSLVDTGDEPPEGWDRWVIPGDGHPDAAAHAHVALLLSRALSGVEPGQESGPPVDGGVEAPLE